MKGMLVNKYFLNSGKKIKIRIKQQVCVCMYTNA